MKTERSLRISPHSRKRAFTLVEVCVGLFIVSVLFAVLLHILATFYGGTQLLQGIAINGRARCDYLGLALQRAAASTTRSFIFNGRLLNSDGTPYLGSSLTLGKPLHAVVDSADFLSASGLTLSPAGGADVNTIVCIGDPRTPMLVTRESRTRPDAQTEISVSVVGINPAMRFACTAPSTSSLAQLTAAKGSAATASDGHAVLVLPNALALPTAKLPQAITGMQIDFPNIVTRTYP